MTGLHDEAFLPNPWVVRLLIASGYSFFLIYAQFGFIDLIHQRGFRGASAQTLMGIMALAGIATSFMMAFAQNKFVHGLRLGLLLGGLATALSLWSKSFPLLLACALVLGMGVAMSTVALASQLNRWVQPQRLGREAGWGTGLAYVFCNIPVVFNAPPVSKGLIAIALALVFLALTRKLCHRQISIQRNDAVEPTRGTTNAMALLLVITVLVWMDSSMFYLIQHTPELKAKSWGDSLQLFCQGGFHFAGALLAGIMLDRGAWRWTGLITWGLFFLGFTLLQVAPGAHLFHAGLYAIGISLYSTHLVALPGYRHGLLWQGHEGLKAGILYGLAGWLGSTLGIGMATDLNRVPLSFLALCGLIIFVFTLATMDISVKTLASRILWPLGACVLLTWGLNFAIPEKSQDSEVERGRQVYINEGCINCHSQYIRPVGEDEKIYGPPRPQIIEDYPPLIGNRRIGPDLSNAGLLKSPLWHKLHLINPRIFNNQSPMPSYEHLFESEKGGELVAYLSSLGKNNWNKYWEERLLAPSNPLQNQFQKPFSTSTMASGSRLYQENCQNCHGPLQRPWNSLAPLHSYGLPAPALAPLVKSYLDAEGQLSSERQHLLYKWIRYGVPNGDMPAHQHLSDQDIGDIIQVLQSDAPAWCVHAGPN